MRLENWALVVEKEYGRITLVCTDDFESGKYSLVGIIYESEDFESGREVVTSKLVEFDGKTAKTKSGSVYKLGEMSNDYKNFLEACNSEEIIVAKGINITKNGTFIARPFVKGDYSEDAKREICGSIVSQDMEENILTLTNMRMGEFKVFPDWLDLELELARKAMFLRNKGEFCNYDAKLDLFGKHKTRVMPYA